MQKQITIFIFAFCLLLNSPLWAQKKIDLRFNLKEGEIFKQKTKSDQVITQSGQRITQTIGFEYLYNILEKKDNGNYVIKTTYTAILYKQDNPAIGEIAYDSKNPTEDIHPMAKGYVALLGKSFQFEMSPKGEVIRFEGIDEMLEAMVDDLGIIDEAQKAQIMKVLKTQYGNEVMEQNLQQSFARYPNSPIKVGDSWLQETKQVTPPIIGESRFILKSKEKDHYVVSATADLKNNPDGKPLQMQAMEIHYNLSGNQNGEMLIDSKTGWVREMEMTQKMSGNMKIQGMEIPIEINTTTTLETIKEK